MGPTSHESAGQSQAEYGRSLQGRVHGSARDWADELAAAGFEAEAVIERRIAKLGEQRRDRFRIRSVCLTNLQHEQNLPIQSERPPGTPGGAIPAIRSGAFWPSALPESRRREGR
jgi:hypothetical protein